MLYVCLNCDEKFSEELPTLDVQCPICQSTNVRELEGFELGFWDDPRVYGEED